MAKAKKNIMRAFSINEISGVDRPAQAGATVSIMKRDEATGGEDDVEKRAALTTVEQGHSHVLVLDYEREHRSCQGHGTTSYQDDHCHPWIMLEDGTIVIGEAMGHTHEVAEIGVEGWKVRELLDAKTTKSTKEGPMAEQDTNKNDEKTVSIEKFEELSAKFETVSKVAELNDAQKAHYQGLKDDTAKAEFLAKSDEDRQAVVDEIEKNAKDDDPIVYKAADGTEFRKSDDPRLVEMAKRDDAREKELIKMRVAAEEVGFAKRAKDEFGNLPGDEKVHVAIVKALSGIPDEEVQKGAFETLKAASDTVAKGFKTTGVDGAPRITAADNGNDKEAANAELDELTKKYQAENPDTNYFAAYDAVSKANPDLLKRAV